MSSNLFKTNSRTLFLFLTLMLIFMFIGTPIVYAANEVEYESGTYTATADGMGTVTVTITIKDNVITEVTIDGPDETIGFGSIAIEQLPEKIIEAQSADVDVISNASMTSVAIKKAAAICLLKASGQEVPEEATPSPSPAPTTPPTPTPSPAPLNQGDTAKSDDVNNGPDPVVETSSQGANSPNIGLIIVCIAAVCLLAFFGYRAFTKKSAGKKTGGEG